MNTEPTSQTDLTLVALEDIRTQVLELKNIIETWQSELRQEKVSRDEVVLMIHA
jgi:hypothetical protein